MLIAIGGALFLVTAVFGLIILINAFKESAGQGLLCMFVPLYIFYYAFARYQSPKKPIVVGGWLGSAALATALIVIGVVQAASDTAEALGQLRASDFQVAGGPAAGGAAAAPAGSGRVMSCNLSQTPARTCNEYRLSPDMDEAAARQHCDTVQIITPQAQRVQLAEGACPTTDAIGKCEPRFGGATNLYYRDPDPSIDNNQAMTSMQQLCSGTFTRL